MRRVLMLAYYFPPLGGIGALRTARFASCLPEFGWRPTVLSPARGAYYRDPSLVTALPADVQVVRTPSLELSRMGKHALRLGGTDTAPAPGRRGLTWIQGLVRRWLYRPDSQIGWYPFAVAAGRRLLAGNHYDVVFSTSFPITAHLVGERLHRDFGVPWVAEFRDLWTDMTRYDSGLRRRFDLRTEGRVLASASRVITVSPTWAELLRPRVGREVSVLTNGFDPVRGRDRRRDQTIVSYVGSYYPDRQDLRPALLALAELRRTGGFANLRFEVVGELHPQLRSLCVETGIADFTDSTGFLDHAQTLERMQEASLLLLAGPLSSAGNQVLRGNIAAKAFEYLGSQRPILCVGDTRADVACILSSFERVALVESGDTAGAHAALSRLLREPAAARAGLQPYTRRQLARGLAEILEATA